MDKATAVRKLHKIIGKGFGYQLDPKALKREDREKAKEELKAATAVRNEARTRLDARRDELLAADQEYQTLRSAVKAAQKHVDTLSSLSHRKPITVGTTDNTFGFHVFHVRADGDNWQEVLDKVTKA